MNKNLSQKNDSQNNDAKIITILPIKYKFLLFGLFTLSSFFVYKLIKELLRFRHHYNNTLDILLLSLFIPLFFILLLTFKHKINSIAIIKIHTLYSLFLFFLSCCIFYFFIHIASSCHFTPTDVLRNGYPPCYEKIKVYHKFYSIIFYNIFLIFTISSASFVFLFRKKQFIEFNRKNSILFSFFLFCITIIPALIEIIVKQL